MRPARMLPCTTRLNPRAISPRPRFHVPCIVLLERNRGHQLDLIPRADPTLVNQVVAHGANASSRDRRRPDDFVLGERLFGEERPRQIQIALRPAGLIAERPHVTDRQGDLLLRERVPERRHVPVEAANRSAFMDDAEPVQIGFGSGKRAVGEIRKRGVEPDGGFGRARAVGTVAGDAGSPVHTFGGPRGRQCPGAIARRCAVLRAELRPSDHKCDGQHERHRSCRQSTPHPQSLYQRMMRAR